MIVNPQFAIDDQGHRTGVLLKPEEFNQLMDLVADVLDSREMDNTLREADRSGEQPLEWDAARQQLGLQ